MRLLERDGEIGLLRRALADATRGRGCAVLVSGSAGMGKTSLVEAVAAQVREPVRVLRAACDDLSTPAPLGAVRDLAAALRGTGAAAVLSAESDVVRLGQALIAELSAPQAPALLVVEDVHWADSSSVDVLTYLVRRCAPLRVAIAATYRHDDLDEDSPWRRALAVLTLPHVHRVLLDPLSREAVAELTAQTDLDALEVELATGGNPLLVREVAAAGAVDATATVRDVALGRMTRTTREGRRLLEALSVVPGRVERRLAAALDDGQALTAVERRHLLDGDARSVWFPHELLRRAVEDSLTPDERREHHARVLAALEDDVVGDGSSTRLVHHAAAADDTRAVARYAPAAAREAVASGAHREALDHYARALSDPSLLDLEEHLALRTEYARELWNLHRMDEAMVQARQAISLCRGREHDRYRAHALTTVSIAYNREEEIHESLAAGREAVALLERYGVTADLGSALCWHAACTVLSPRHDETHDLVRRAIGVGEALGDKGIVGHALIVRGQASWQLPSGLDDMLAGIDLVTAAGWRNHRMWGLHELGTRLVFDGDLRAALAAFRDARDLAEDLQRETWATEALTCELLVLVSLGEWRAAEEGMRSALRRPVELPESLFEIHGLLGRLLARRGDGAAREHVDEAWRLARAGPDAVWRMLATVARLEEAWLTGHVDDVAAAVPKALAVTVEGSLFWERGLLSVYARRAGLPAEPFADCPEPWASALRGDHHAAAREWARRGDRYERAMELVSLGDCESLMEALRLLDGLGAAGAGLLVRRRLRALGVRAPAGPRSATRANPGGLTARQLDVLALLAEGLTDAEIAERLVVSVRTVHHHVSAVLQALGARTRRDAVREARERELLGTTA